MAAVFWAGVFARLGVLAVVFFAAVFRAPGVAAVAFCAGAFLATARLMEVRLAADRLPAAAFVAPPFLGACQPTAFAARPLYRARLARDVAERLFHVVDETLSSHHTPRAGSVFTYSMRLNILGRRRFAEKTG
ncbi:MULTISPECIES: hypothetical protein [Mycobacterium]|uniref:Uncharacterized protein n=1 Tax=Mycobacterium bohemicum TaxID=56425 RepID=A0A1X1R1M0_MYCBE|nr:MULTISPECIES: hypothetical protein [Mycobacterium]MCV6971365.1 hypothetical protein [Mycobacterium bohemicum]MCV7093088.1 hypothetical protein [Mycobacterium interjectum]ORU97814.1 hypothetical protein AWB93_16430 [Mycobacterium bohemicum]